MANSLIQCSVFEWLELGTNGAPTRCTAMEKKRFYNFVLVISFLGLLAFLVEEVIFGWQTSIADIVGNHRAWLFENHPDGVAVCISGNLRTFTSPSVFTQIRSFHETLWGPKASFFLYGTLASAGPKGQQGFNRPAINVYNQTALDTAVAALGPDAVEFVENAEVVTEENIAHFVLHQVSWEKGTCQIQQTIWGNSSYWHLLIRVKPARSGRKFQQQGDVVV